MRHRRRAPNDVNNDSDGDGSCDSVDLCTGNDTSGDTDSDGVCDDTDVCPERCKQRRPTATAYAATSVDNFATHATTPAAIGDMRRG